MKTILLKNPLYINIFLSLSFAILLLALRAKLTHSYFYFFLIWNLFLAGIPFFITQVMKFYKGWESSWLQKTILFSTWLLFLPNSPYIITDLIHLHDDDSVLLWFDLFLVFVFALNGLLLGLLSLIDMYGFIVDKYTKKAGIFMALIVSILCGYGIYLGRFLRFNSWDILTDPIFLFEQIGSSLTQPKVWAITFAFGGLLWILFSLIRSVVHTKEKLETSLLSSGKNVVKKSEGPIRL